METITEAPLGKSGRSAGVVDKPQSLEVISSIQALRKPTQSNELDRVLGGGVVPGSVILLAGEPGIGKSTLLLRLAEKLAASSAVLYVSGEESAQQIKLRAERLSISSKNIFLSTETDVDNLVTQIRENKPTLLIIDSIQTLTTTDLTGVAGSVGQVRESAARLQEVAKSMSIPLFLIGHVTKEGSIAGPKVLEHLVDVVLSLEGERFHSLRLLRGVKNRFGATDEVGLFEMNEKGLLDVSDPAKLFLTDAKSAAGSVVVVAQQGLRPMLIEIQALVLPSKIPIPRRVASGFDFNRLQMLTAIIQKHLRLPLSDFDVYLNVASGFRITEPAADLGVCLAIISSFKNKPLPPKTAVIGEVGLLGEIRTVSQEARRVKEAKKLGFTNILTSQQKNLLFVSKNLFS